MNLRTFAVICTQVSHVLAFKVQGAPGPDSFFNEQRTRWMQSCANTSVLDRSTGNSQSFGWSVSPATYRPDPDTSLCKSSDELLASLRHGSRTYSGDTSAFVPASCSYAWYSVSAMCEIMSRYSTVHLLGDSITRHYHQGLLMLLTDDWKFGGLPRLSPQQQLYEQCACDGQFSEHEICRTYSNSMLGMTSSHSYGICSGFPRFAISRDDSFTGDDVLKCSNDARPQLLLMQGGAHFQSDSNMMMQHLGPLLAKLEPGSRGCTDNNTHPVHMVWTGLNAQSKILDERYPHQALDKAIGFNHDIQHYLFTHHKDFDISILDFVPLTLNASSSDGYHFLSDVNLVKAMYTLNLMDLLTAGPLQTRHMYSSRQK